MVSSLCPFELLGTPSGTVCVNILLVKTDIICEPGNTIRCPLTLR